MQDLNDLRFFAAVVSSGGFSKAARELGLPKSRLSRRVAQLEADLGVRLLERSTRRLKVTEVGQEVYAQAVTAAAAAAAAEAAIEAALRVRAEP
jgi:DNA-binding transcriptional LysR family regulator